MPAVRVVWARDRPGTALADSKPLSLNGDQRRQIEGHTVETQRLVLSALGAWADLSGVWDSVPPSNVVGWHHVVVMGRDQYVRVVQRGHLAPFGHRAAQVEITERKLKRTPNGSMVDVLARLTFIVVTESVRDFEAPGVGQAFAHKGNELPLRRVRLLTSTTPALDGRPPAVEGRDEEGFPLVGGVPFAFHLVANDWDGQEIDFSLPLRFIKDGEAAQMTPLYGAPSKRQADLRNQLVAFAPNGTGPSAPGATQLKARTITFRLQSVPGLIPPFLPEMEKAEVAIPAIEHLLGSAGVPGMASIAFHPSFLQAGFGGTNTAQVFAKLADDSSLPLRFPADKAGGLAAPVMDINGLSRSFGPVSRVDDLVNGQFDPRKVFSTLEAKLLGGIGLGDVLSAVADLEQKVPTLLHSRTPKSLITSFTWQPKVALMNSDAPGSTSNRLPLVTTPDTQLTIRARAEVLLQDVPTGMGEPAFVVEGVLTSFAINIVGVLLLTVGKLSFRAEPGKKVDVRLNDIELEFVGALSFLNNLAEVLPKTGFSDGPAVQATPDGVTAGYSIGLPSTGVGAFSLENIALSAQLTLPFTRPVGLRLSFSDRSHPFLVTVSLIGGGGYFALNLTTAGIDVLEGSVELGANVTLDLAVVSANVHVMVGFYFAKAADGSVAFSGYVRVGGSVDLLGLVSVSIELYLALDFFSKPKPGIIGGQASLTVGIHVAFFNKSLTLHVERHFAIPPRANLPVLGNVRFPFLSDPSFEEMVTRDDWRAYCLAFA
jgi:hypothetical protein